MYLWVSCKDQQIFQQYLSSKIPLQISTITNNQRIALPYQHLEEVLTLKRCAHKIIIILIALCDEQILLSGTIVLFCLHTPRKYDNIDFEDSQGCVHTMSYNLLLKQYTFVLNNYYLFIVKCCDHIIGKRYISTCYVCIHVKLWAATMTSIKTWRAYTRAKIRHLNDDSSEK